MPLPGERHQGRFDNILAADEGRIADDIVGLGPQGAARIGAFGAHGVRFFNKARRPRPRLYIYCVAVATSLGAPGHCRIAEGIMFRSFRPVFKFALLAATALSVPAFAQDAAWAPEEGEARGRKDDEIVGRSAERRVEKAWTQTC